MNKLSKEQVITLAKTNGYEPAALHAIIAVESGSIGFASDTSKIIIQFEPSWFKRLAPKEYTNYVLTKALITGNKPVTQSQLILNANWATILNNGVRGQHDEWSAFNLAFNINPEAAMGATSIGMMQIMGFHWKTLGFKSVGEMWDYAKEGEANQVDLAIRFIKSNPTLDSALKNKNWKVVAYYYNGAGYKKFNYDHRLEVAYNVYQNQTS